MKTVDIVNGKETLNFQQQNILLGMLNGIVISHKGTEYRFAEKNTELYSEGELTYCALNTGLFQKMTKYSTNSDEESHIWLGCGESMGALLTLIRNLTEVERVSALACISLNKVNNVTGFKQNRFEQVG